MGKASNRQAIIFAKDVVSQLRSCRRITNVESEENSTEGKNVFVCLTSDRGLCGGINSSIIKRVRAKAKEIDGDLELVIVGQKGESGLGREFGRSITMSAVEMGKKVIWGELLVRAVGSH